MTREELLINDIMEILNKLHSFDSYDANEVDSIKTCISHTVINHDRNDLQAILETLEEHKNVDMLSGTDRAVYYGVITRLKTMMQPVREKIKIEDITSALSWIRQKLSNHEYIGELNDYAWYNALMSIDTAIDMLEDNPEESFD